MNAFNIGSSLLVALMFFMPLSVFMADKREKKKGTGINVFMENVFKVTTYKDHLISFSTIFFYTLLSIFILGKFPNIFGLIIVTIYGISIPFIIKPLKNKC